MSSERLTGSEKRALWMWVALGILGAYFGHKYFFQAFPEASVNFKVSRDQALNDAQQFIAGLGEDTRSYQSAIIFNLDDKGKTYLERNLGLQQANQLMSSQLNIWYWEVRFFKPQQEEEFRVRVSPTGNIVGYDHHIEESRAGPTLDRASAQTAAQQFLANNLGRDLTAWNFLPEEINSTKRSNRLDWSFTWEKRGFRAADAPYRMQVNLQGERIGAEGEFLKVPEVWQRDFAKLRSSNDFLTTVALLPYLFLLGAAIWLGFSLTRQGRTTWTLAIKLGVVIAIVLCLMQLNSWPLERMSYDTKQSYSTFVFLQFLKALLFGIGSVLTISLVLPGAESLYRASQPQHLRLREALTLCGLRSKEFFSAAVVGMSMAAAHIGFIVAFYIIATYYGAWAPQELNYENSVGTPFPWISGVAIGLLASTNEEFTFRLFAIPFFRRLTGSRILAVVIPAFCWSFLHSNYPQEPAYIRGIEIGLVGIVAGVVMLRWGILATLIWHYTVDASLVGLFLVRSNSMYFKISGVIVAAAALAPFLFSAVSYLARGKFEPDEDLLNGAEPQQQISFSTARESHSGAGEVRRYDPLKPAMLGFLVFCLLAGGIIAWRARPHAIGDDVKFSVDARSAQAIADKIIQQRGLQANSYHHATTVVDITDAVTNEFLRQRVGIARLNQIYANQIPGALWRVRYFREGQAEEYAVILKPDGSLHSLRHTLAEDAPGASLSKDEAQTRAAKFLQEEKKIDLEEWSLVEANSDKRPHRIDHELTWQQNAALDSEQATNSPANSADHAHARIEIDVLGDDVANYRTYIKIPDDWRRKREELTLSRMVLSYVVPGLFYVGLGLTALIIFLKNLRSAEAQAIPWRRLLVWSMWGLAAYVLAVSLGDTIPAFLSSYRTEIPLKTMFGGVAIGLLLGAPFNVAGITFLFGLAWYFGTKAFGPERLPGWRGMPGNYYRDAFFIAVGGTAALLGLTQLIALVSEMWPTVHRAAGTSFDQKSFDAILPAAGIIGGSVMRGLYITGGVAAIGAFVAAQIKQPIFRVLLLMIAALAMVGGSWGNGADFAKQFILRLVLLAALAAGVRWVMRFNIMGGFLTAVCTVLVGAASELLTQPNHFYRANGIVLVAGLALLLGWPLLSWRMNASTIGVEETPNPGGIL